MVDRFQIALRRERFQPRFLHGDFRIAPSFTFSCPPPTAVPHGDFWDNRETSGWVGQAAGMFSHFLFCFFFLLTPLLQPSHRTLPSSLTDTAALSLQGPPAPTTDCDDGSDT